ncbi:MAG: alkaline phosphatase family protein [Acidobacteria bacterium]|nr:alkaline phosphatase family protein [Acidobacteriota bacterium]
MIVFKKWQTFFLAGLIAVSSAISAADDGPQTAPRRPKLVVILVLDQMRNDYIDLYGSRWTGGLRRLLKNGARFKNAAYPYLNTVTCAGHATIGTGTFPHSHGMILNGWLDRRTSRTVSCTDDPKSPLIGYGKESGGGNSAINLLRPTLAGALREAGSGASRVVTVAGKARSAIMLAGPNADYVTWYEWQSGIWVTSSAYAKEPVPWISKYIQANPVENDFKKTWRLFLPRKSYLFSDGLPGEKPPEGWTQYFPHPMHVPDTSSKPESPFYGVWQSSPFGEAYIGKLAELSVDELKLGRGDATDFLGVSFSGLDLVGHAFGPHSWEIQDMLAQLDQIVGSLLAHLDRSVGPENYVVALTADHGVAPVVEQSKKEHKEAGFLLAKDIEDHVEKILDHRWGDAKTKYIARELYTDLYFAKGIYEKLLADPETLTAVVDSIRSIPGVLRVYRTEEVREVPAPGGADPYLRAAALSYSPGRSGDLIIIPKENWFFASGSPPREATTHGTSHPYDQHVPVIIAGRNIRAGVYQQAASPADIAPTFAALAGIPFPTAEGRVLLETFFASPSPATPAPVKP